MYRGTRLAASFLLFLTGSATASVSGQAIGAGEQELLVDVAS